MSEVDQVPDKFMQVANIMIRFKNNPEGLVSDYAGEILELFKD